MNEYYQGLEKTNIYLTLQRQSNGRFSVMVDFFTESDHVKLTSTKQYTYGNAEKRAREVAEKLEKVSKQHQRYPLCRNIGEKALWKFAELHGLTIETGSSDLYNIKNPSLHESVK